MNKRTGQDFSDLSMLDLFCLEAESQSAILMQGLLDLEDNEIIEEKLEILMRASHSIKGAARIVGIEAIVTVSHLMEDCFVAAQHGVLTLNSTHIDFLLRAVDIILQIARVGEDGLEDFLSNHREKISAIEKHLRQIIADKEINAEAGTAVSSSEKKQIGNLNEPVREVEENEQAGSLSNRNSTAKHSIDAVVRVDARRMTRILGLSSELVVESRWLKPLSESMFQLKKQHSELTNILENLRESLLDSQALSDQDNLHFSTAQKKLAECRNLLTENLLDLDDYDRRNYNLSSRIYNEVIGTRMRPFVEATQGLQRMVRDLARSLNKKVLLEISGQETPIDSDVAEKIKSPLNHLVRNAVDHGVETNKERDEAGKPSSATVKISAHHGGGMLTVMVEDDGRGIDVGALKEKVVAREFAAQSMADKMTDSELVEFLFLPDFSTRDSVSEISGRGVGLDVVHSMIAEMHGSVRIENRQGQGVKFILQMPVTLSVLTAIVVMVGDEYYAFPLSRIERLESVGFEKIRTVNKEQYVTVNERDIRIISAAQVLELGAGNSSGEQLNIVVVKKGDHSYGVVVDSFLGQRELSVQALDARLGKIQDISAAALMEDGSPVLIVDVDDLLRSVEILISGGFASSFARQANPNDGIKRKRILVVDDSLTVREVEKKLLVDQGYQVDIAVDGMDGWNAIRRSDYDLLITDVDMPRMDGIELVELLKQDHRLEALPVMIVSYKDRREDRQRGLEAGADYYLSKGSFHDETLIEAVIDLIGEARE